MPSTPKLLEMMSRLVSEPSISSTQAQFDQSNLGVISVLAEWLEHLDFDVKISPVNETAGKFNLIATLGQGDQGLLLSGHTDTVPCDADLWNTNPFHLTEKDGRFYGLGTCDMKCFFALAIDAMQGLAAAHLNAPITILATCDEESSMNGARALTHEDVHRSAYAVIGEPTDLQPIRCHKGIMMLGIRLKGQSGHSSNPALGNNAMNALAPVLDELDRFRQELQKKYQNETFAVTFPTLNLGCIHGGDNPNRICDQVDLQIDVRILPGMDNLLIRDELQQRLVTIIHNYGLSGSVELLHAAVPAFETPASGSLLPDLEKICDRPAGSVAYATEAPFLQNLALETMVMGPGSINQAHQPNEFIESKQLPITVDIIGRLIKQYCI